MTFIHHQGLQCEAFSFGMIPYHWTSKTTKLKSMVNIMNKLNVPNWIFDSVIWVTGVAGIFLLLRQVYIMVDLWGAMITNNHELFVTLMKGDGTKNMLLMVACVVFLSILAWLSDRGKRQIVIKQ